MKIPGIFQNSNNPGDYSQIFADVNAQVNPREIQQVQFSKTLSNKTDTQQLNVVYQPGMLQATQISKNNNITLTNSINNQLSINSQVNFHNESLSASALLTVTPETKNQSMMERMQGVIPEIQDFKQDLRIQTHISGGDFGTTFMVNKVGGIVAVSHLQQVGPYLQVGGEYVEVMDRDVKMFAGAAKVSLGNKTQLIGQVNSQHTGALGFITKFKDYALGLKVHLIKGEDGLHTKEQIGISRTFQRGVANINIDSKLNLNASGRIALSNEAVAEVAAGSNVFEGGIKHFGVGFVF